MAYKNTTVFASLMERELSRKEKNLEKTVLTENGAVGYSSSGEALLDLNFKLSSYRHKSEEEIWEDFKKAFTEEPELTL